MPETPFNVAEIVVCPGAIGEAIPVLVMVATAGLDEFQVADEVKSFVLPSE